MVPGKTRRGSAMLEFTLIGIPMMFVWISIIQMSMGMWQYHTLQEATKATGAYLAVHGSTCSTQPNNCAITISNAATLFHNLAFGMPSTSVNVTFSAVASDHVTVASSVSCRLDSCLTNTTAWPPTGNNTPGQDIAVKAVYQLHAPLAMFVPGAGAPQQSGVFYLPGYTHQTILF
jgi:Flp pilus assembly protein TadG